MITNKYYEYENGFSAVSVDELLYVNGGCGSSSGSGGTGNSGNSGSQGSTYNVTVFVHVGICPTPHVVVIPIIKKEK